MADDDRADPTTGPFTATGTDVDATSTMPENVPSTEGAEQIGRREGMFGVSGTGDTSGYAGLESAVEKVVVFRGEITFFIRREDIAATARLLRDEEQLRYELCSGVSG